MKFTELHKLGPADSRIPAIMVEAAPTLKMDYLNYDNDPRPHVLVFSTYKHPKTGNDLIDGVNLNYLSKGQLEKLSGDLDRIFASDNPKVRYRLLDRLHGDISQYYRSYDEAFIRKVESTELGGFLSQAADGGGNIDKKEKDKTERLGDTKDARIKPQEPEDTEELDDHVGAERDTWQLDRQLHDPETGKHTEPEKERDEVTKREKKSRYQTQHKELDRKEELTQLAKELRDLDDLDQEEPLDLGSEDEANPDDVYESFHCSPDLGLIWNSPEEYIRYHNPKEFIKERKIIGSILEASFGGKVVAAFDVITNQLIVDLGNDHLLMLHEANWGDTRSILFEVDGTEVLIKHDFCTEKDLKRAVHAFQNSIVPLLMEESA